MKRAFAVSLMVAVVATSLLGPAEAAKKKKPKKPPAPVQTEASYFLRRDGEDCADPAALFLSLVDAEDIDPGSCGSSNYGLRAPLGGADPRTYATREGDGVPVVLDATKDITGMIGVKSQSAQGAVRWGVGETTLNVEIAGTTADGEETSIGSTTVDYDVMPGNMDQVYEVEFTLTPDAALDKATFTSVKITISNSGNSLHHGFYTTDNPASYFKMGIWK